MHKLITVFIALSIASLGANAADEIDPQELADQWTAAYNAHNPAALAELYEENAIMMLHGDLVLRGRDAIHDYWVDDFREGNPLTTLTVTHTVQGVEMMLVHGDYHVVDRNDGILLGRGRFAHIWLRDGNGEWLLDRDLWNEPFQPYFE
ncbi:MAG: YybH family protein [Gammaproteobacteria bacterium]